MRGMQTSGLLGENTIRAQSRSNRKRVRSFVRFVKRDMRRSISSVIYIAFSISACLPACRTTSHSFFDIYTMLDMCQIYMLAMYAQLSSFSECFNIATIRHMYIVYGQLCSRTSQIALVYSSNSQRGQSSDSLDREEQIFSLIHRMVKGPGSHGIHDP